MTRDIPCTNVNSYGTSLEPANRQATDHRARITRPAGVSSNLFSYEDF